MQEPSAEPAGLRSSTVPADASNENCWPVVPNIRKTLIWAPWLPPEAIGSVRVWTPGASVLL